MAATKAGGMPLCVGEAGRQGGVDTGEHNVVAKWNGQPEVKPTRMAACKLCAQGYNKMDEGGESPSRRTSPCQTR